MKTNQHILAVSAALILATSLGAQKIPDPSPSCPEFASMTPCLWQPPYCGDDCDNTPYCRTNCSTTGSSDTNSLYCEYGTYANCHDSGPPWPTGMDPDNIPLPCKLNADGTMADCKCKVFHGHNYVNTSEIMNLGVFYETIKVCGSDGSKCQNSSTCPGENCVGEIPPICKYIVGQSPDNPETSLIPGADLISTYGYGMLESYPDVSPTSTTCNDIVIADCMTAPCLYEDNDPESGYAQCACPTIYMSSYTLSQDGQICNLPEGYVWE